MVITVSDSSIIECVTYHSTESQCSNAAEVRSQYVNDAIPKNEKDMTQ